MASIYLLFPCLVKDASSLVVIGWYGLYTIVLLYVCVSSSLCPQIGRVPSILAPETAYDAEKHHGREVRVCQSGVGHHLWLCQGPGQSSSPSLSLSYYSTMNTSGLASVEHVNLTAIIVLAHYCGAEYFVEREQKNLDWLINNRCMYSYRPSYTASSGTYLL